MRVRLSRRKLIRGALWGLLCLGATVGLFLLGRHVTPTTGAARPVIYAPAVRRTETYRRQARAWLDELQALDGVLVALVTSDRQDVYALSDAGARSLDVALRLDQAVGLVYSPASLVGLRNGLQEAADLYLEAAVAVNLWVGEPTPETYLASLEALRLARHTRAAVAANPWLATSVAPAPVGDPPVAPTAPGWGE